jgi:UDP-3-O-[3-hydroxymyristoyl] glucosamine N-acyltransferase
MRSFTLGELAKLTNSSLIGDSNYLITGFADLESAKPNDISFLSNHRYIPTRYLSAMKRSLAGAIFIAPSVRPTEDKNFLIIKDPSWAFQQTIEAMKGIPKQTAFDGIHSSAVIHPTARISENVTIGPHAVIDGEVVVGKGCFIGANCYIGPQVTLGESCHIHPNVTIREQCQLGDRVIIQSGAVIGECGFGYSTNEKGKHLKLAHVGIVVIENDVEIGSNTTIDRARFTETVIGKGSKIDNLVAIGHNVKIGKDNIICGQAGIAGSAETEESVIIAGQAGLNGHIKIGKSVVVAAQSGVTKNLARPGSYKGHPAIPTKEFNKLFVLQRNIDIYIEQIRELQKRVEKLEADNIVD